MSLISLYSDLTIEVIATVIMLAVAIFLRIITAKLIRRYAKLSLIMEHRTNLVIKYIHILINILAIVGLVVIWGVQKKDILFTLSSVTTVVGVAMFAQWSILSNITSGIILFFFFPFRIGDVIQVHDKDFPIQAEIEDIKAFHIYLKTKDGQRITYPNNLLLQKGISIITPEYNDREFTD
ncbi:MAG: mechanosensitive ion channel family protein [Flavobacterium sp.]